MTATRISLAAIFSLLASIACPIVAQAGDSPAGKRYVWIDSFVSPSGATQQGVFASIVFNDDNTCNLHYPSTGARTKGDWFLSDNGNTLNFRTSQFKGIMAVPGFDAEGRSIFNNNISFLEYQGKE